jgi:ABC-2 type transport system permease protein
MRKYAKLLSNFTQVSFTYRSNIIGSILAEAIFTSSVLMLWVSVFRSNQTVGGLKVNEIILYFLFVPFFGYLTKTNQASKISREIKRGVLSNQLIKPYTIFVSNFVETIGFKINYFVFIIPIYCFILILFFLKNPGVQITWQGVAITIIFSILSFILNFIAELSIAYSAFWLDEIWALDHIKTILLWLFGGVTFPFELLSTQLRIWFDLLPFKFTYYIPISYLLGNRNPEEYLLFDIAVFAFWCSIFTFLAIVLWRKGIRRYGAYGN